MENKSLQRIDDARKALEDAKDLNDILKIKDIGMAAKEYARAAKLGLDVQNKAAEITLRAERKAGEYFQELERGKNNQYTAMSSAGHSKSDYSQALDESNTKRQEANRWQKIANIPEDTFEEIITDTKEAQKELTESMMLKVEKEITNEERKKTEKENSKPINDIEIRSGDFKVVLDDINNIDAIITDPPYPKEYIKCFSDLSLYAKEHLKDGGFLVCYSGQYNLPEVIERLSEHLTYVWTFCLYHVGKKQLVNGVNIMCGWKPVLIFSKGNKKMRFSAYDVLESKQMEKDLHEWQQSESGVEKLIEIFTEPEQLVVDPFAGSGTFLKVSNKLGRKAIGADIDA